jgi:hypothetical protein
MPEIRWFGSLPVFGENPRMTRNPFSGLGSLGETEHPTARGQLADYDGSVMAGNVRGTRQPVGPAIAPVAATVT